MRVPIRGGKDMRSPGRVAARRVKALLLLACGAWLLSVAVRAQAEDPAAEPAGAMDPYIRQEVSPWQSMVRQAVIRRDGNR